MCTQNTAPFARLQQSHIRTIASVTQPRASKAAALPGSRGACVHLRSLSACTLARKGKPSKCARQIRAGIAIICAAPSSSTAASTASGDSEAAALPGSRGASVHLRSLSGIVAGAQKQAAKMRAACARKTPRRLRGSSSHTSERLHQQRSRERAKLQLCQAAAVHACI